jgi:hypothetical protein
MTMRERFSCSRWMPLTLPVAALDVDARLRRHFRHLLECHARFGELLLVHADLLVQLLLARLQLHRARRWPRSCAPRSWSFLLDVQRLLFRRDGEVLLVALQLRAGALALILLLAQLLLGGARALFGDDARVVRGAQFLLERLQLRGDAAGARFLAAEERSRSAISRLIENTPGVAPSVLPPMTSGPRTMSPSSVTNVAFGRSFARRIASPSDPTMYASGIA